MELKDLMMLYGVTLGRRKTKKQRYLFAKEVKEAAEKNGFSFEVVGHKTPRYNVENIIVGDIHAPNIIAVGYDTPNQSIIPVNYYPFHTEQTLKSEHLNIIIRFLISALCVGIAYLFIHFAEHRIICYIGAAVFAFLTVYEFIPKANVNNFNRYSSSVALAMKLMEDVKKGKMAIVFCDKITSGYDGFRLLNESISDMQLVWVLDTIAYGEKMVVSHSVSTTKHVDEICKELNAIDKEYSLDEVKNNVLGQFNRCIFITSGEIKDNDFVVRNTASSKDVQLDLKRLEKIEMIIKKCMEEKE